MEDPDEHKGNLLDKVKKVKSFNKKKKIKREKKKMMCQTV